MAYQDQRLNELNLWLENLMPALCEQLGWTLQGTPELVPASSDASFRRYFRWSDGAHSLILMDAPPPQENCQPFVAMAELLHQGGLNVPQVLASDLERGYLVLSDLGRRTYLEVMTETAADGLFEGAIQSLLKLQLIPIPDGLPAYDQALLKRELELFPEWYVGRELGTCFDVGQQGLWDQISALLIDSALAQPQVLVHRDYMPRNLMPGDPQPGVLDFQDAVRGPVTYDITSLFKDAFLSWPQDRIDQWQLRYWQAARDLGIPVQGDFADFQRASDLMGAQRHLKVIGIFSRICHRDGKPRYLADVPRFMDYLNAVIARRPELAPLQQLLQSLPQEPRP